MELAGRTVVVTGASNGIGRALTCELVGAGAQVIAAARSADKLAELAAQLGAAVRPLRCDVANARDVERLAEEAGAVDVVVNNAGIGHVEPFLVSDPARWRQTLDTNLIGALLVTRAFLPAMLEARCGVIINVGSSSTSGWPYLTLYAASKAALQVATQALDHEHAHSGVRVRYVELGPTAGTAFGLASDPEYLPLAAQAWTALGIPWQPDQSEPQSAAQLLRAAIERALTP